MTSNSYQQIEYLNLKYIELGLSCNKSNSTEWFDPNIYPDTRFIPLCKICNLDFDNCKNLSVLENMEIEFKHPKSCLWYDYFVNKVKNIYPRAKIVRKKSKKN